MRIPLWFSQIAGESLDEERFIYCEAISILKNKKPASQKQGGFFSKYL
jgi:hypothetical protein